MGATANVVTRENKLLKIVASGSSCDTLSKVKKAPLMQAHFVPSKIKRVERGGELKCWCKRFKTGVVEDARVKVNTLKRVAEAV